MLTNLLIIGNTNSGKTAYIKKLMEDWDYHQHHGGEVRSYETMVCLHHPILGDVHIYDSCEAHVVNDIYDCVIIMCAEKLPPIEQYKNEIVEKCGDIPVIILFNKLDLEDARLSYHAYLEAHPEDMVRSCSVKDQNIGMVEDTFKEIVSLAQD